MNDDPNTTPPENNPSASGDAWRDMGQQFQQLGDSIAQAVRTAWEDEATQRQVREIQAGLDTMVQDVSKAVKDSANSPTGQQLRGDAKRAAESLRTAGEQTVQEVRPHLLSALQEANEALRKMIDRMEQKQSGQADTPPEAPGE